MIIIDSPPELTAYFASKGAKNHVYLLYNCDYNISGWSTDLTTAKLMRLGKTHPSEYSIEKCYNKLSNLTAL